VTDYAAFDSLEPAYQRTTKTLFKPFNFTFWLKLALVSLLVGGVGGGGNRFTEFADESRELGAPLMAFVGAILLFVILIILLFAVLSNIGRFVFLNAVLSKKIRVRKSFKRFAGSGLRVLAFSVGLLALFVAEVAVFTAAAALYAEQLPKLALIAAAALGVMTLITSLILLILASTLQTRG